MTPTRRDFLTTSAAAAATLGALATTHAADPPATAPAKRPLKKGLMFSMYQGGGSLTDKFKALKEAGFDGVELDAPGRFKPDDVRAACAASGLEVEGVVDAFHWNVTLSDPDPRKRALAVETLKNAIRECKAFGGTSVLLVPAVVSKRVSYADAYARSQEEIRKALPVAQETGVKIAIENVWNHFLLSPLEAARYVDEFQSPLVGWHFDIGNVVTFGWPEHWVQILGKRILKLHIKEYSRAKRDKEGPYKGFDVELLEGDNDWPTIMKALDAIGYTGWGSAEVRGGGPDRMKDIAQRMDRIWAC